MRSRSLISSICSLEIGSSNSLSSQMGEKLHKISYPKTIQSLIKNIGDLNSNRDKLHRKLKKIPEANTKDNIAKRKETLDLIKETTDLLEHYYQLKDRFFTEKIVPTEEDLKFKKEDKSKKKTKPINPIKDMSEAELIKKLQNLRSNLTKKKNKLLYQSVSKKKEENPMPEGARRDHLSAQVKTDEKQIQEIQERLDAFNKAK